ncbi:hypothetical protein [Streptomyces nanshensis]|uniref:Uncharacterized protein n=1 Tax=Streptomyces nanshensis TaxID=518642 RepID=A0A1E7LBC7_9ACTN|nr:hypothetical protein [Streptomyces nanshensis]OEV13401.1 hypothetical protein AN218_03685 [Streptomyces nanshensis]
MLSFPTPLGTVRAETSRPACSGAVDFRLSGAVSGTVHANVTHTPRQWDDFGTIRVSLGDVDPLYVAEPTNPVLVRKVAYRGHVQRTGAGSPWEPGVGGITKLCDGHPAPPQADRTLRIVLEGCANAYAERADLPQLRNHARAWEAPQLLTWLARIIPDEERQARREERAATAHRGRATRFTRLGWAAAGLFRRQPAEAPDVPLALLLAGVAGEAQTAAHAARDAAHCAASTRRLVAHMHTERAGLRDVLAAADPSGAHLHVVPDLVPAA